MYKIMFLALVVVFSPPTSVIAGENLTHTNQIISIRNLRDQCIEFKQLKYGEGPLDYGDCRVSEFGEIGKINNLTYHYALYCLIPSHSIEAGKCDSKSFNARYFKQRGMAIFVQEGTNENVRLLESAAFPEIGMYVYEKPEIIKNVRGVFLYVPIALDGTGHGNESEYYIWEDGRWQRIESVKWLDDLRKRLPPEFELWTGIWPDVGTMKAKAPLYRKGDSNCCPSGGTAEVTLSIENNQFRINSMTITAESMTKGHRREIN